LLTCWPIARSYSSLVPLQEIIEDDIWGEVVLQVLDCFGPHGARSLPSPFLPLYNLAWSPWSAYPINTIMGPSQNQFQKQLVLIVQGPRLQELIAICKQNYEPTIKLKPSAKNKGLHPHKCYELFQCFCLCIWSRSWGMS
jgi:hypothetical protein